MAAFTATPQDTPASPMPIEHRVYHETQDPEILGPRKGLPTGRGYYSAARNRAAPLLVGTGIHPDLAAALSTLETGRGGPDWLKNAGRDNSYNYFNIKAREGEKVGAEFDAEEHIGGKDVLEPSKFRAFDSYEDSVQGLIERLNLPIYRKVLEAKTPEAQAQALADSPYSTDPDQAEKLLSIMNRKR